MRESELIADICKHNAELAACGGAEVLLAPGDDMALVKLAGLRVLVAADQVIAGRHFAAGTPMDQIARKALARNISDIAAMAGVPACAVATVALPAAMPDHEVRALAEGLRAAALVFQCPVVGGDIGTHAAADGALVVSVSVLAEPGPTGRVVTRAGACVGDLLCVTGTLGDGWRSDGSGRHLSFTPRIAEALALVEALGDRLHAMIDISDGLARDAGHLATASGLAVRIDGAQLPCAAGAGWQAAVGTGEDYELAFACAGQPPSSVAGTPVTVVGRFQEPGGARVSVCIGTEEHDVSALGWEHG
ncbi:MAG: thiamine-phosphate kinase [Planctomycetota bacterium]|nr:thiamine-phosphate kinase [Planctomycetota bacterium]